MASTKKAKKENLKSVYIDPGMNFACVPIPCIEMPDDYEFLRNERKQAVRLLLDFGAGSSASSEEVLRRYLLEYYYYDLYYGCNYGTSIVFFAESEYEYMSKLLSDEHVKSILKIHPVTDLFSQGIVDIDFTCNGLMKFDRFHYYLETSPGYYLVAITNRFSWSDSYVFMDIQKEIEFMALLASTPNSHHLLNYFDEIAISRLGHEFVQLRATVSSSKVPARMIDLIDSTFHKNVDSILENSLASSISNCSVFEPFSTGNTCKIFLNEESDTITVLSSYLIAADVSELLNDSNKLQHFIARLMLSELATLDMKVNDSYSVNNNGTIERTTSLAYFDTIFDLSREDSIRLCHWCGRPIVSLGPNKRRQCCRKGACYRLWKEKAAAHYSQTGDLEETLSLYPDVGVDAIINNATVPPNKINGYKHHK